MILNLGSAIFNAETASGGGTPSWGTEMGQGDGYKFNFEDYESMITSLVYNSVPEPKSRVSCPLGKGGKQAGDYEFVIAAKYDKIFVNNMPVPNASFVLLVIKKLVGRNHVGRRTLKYSPHISLDGAYYNRECFDAIASKLGVASKGSWFISQISTCEQDELHFTAHILNADSKYEFVDSDDRKNVLSSKISAYAEAKEINALKRYAQRFDFSRPLQQIFFGAPGTGKSYSINCNACITDDNSIRTTFHPDCDYSTFVGCYKPALNDASGELTYRFVPQAFTEAYVRAWLKPDEPFFLIIEEINRGNCAQIFGDVFQLLDRDDRGYSAYRIAPDRDLQRYLQQQFADSDIGDASIKSGKKMQLPPNLHIWATMNTSDQSLFPIDSAFKRRWDWRYVPIDCTDHGHYIDCGGGRRYVWASFVRQANERIEAVTQSEDKKLGYWFAARKGHDAISSDRFVSKVVFYLWNDVFKDCAGEAGSIFTGNCDSFHRFFTDGGEVNADLVAEFLDGLGVERLEPAVEPQTDA